MFLVAVTGGIATGKSSIVKLFKERGVPVIDADLIARQIVEPGKAAWHEIKEEFGQRVLKENGEIDRDILGKIVFTDLPLRRKLNHITHPKIHRSIFIEIFQYFMSGTKYVVMDLPLLFETGILLDFIHKIITVSCDVDAQVERLMKRSSLSEEDARKRIAAQMPLEQKCEKSHFVIDNSHNFANTEKEVLQILDVLNASNQHWKIRFYILASVFAITLFVLWLNSLFKFVDFGF